MAEIKAFTPDGRYMITATGTQDRPDITVHNWSEEAGTFGDFIPVVTVQSAEELSRHVDTKNVVQFIVPDFPPDEEVSA